MKLDVGRGFQPIGELNFDEVSDFGAGKLVTDLIGGSFVPKSTAWQISNYAATWSYEHHRVRAKTDTLHGRRTGAQEAVNQFGIKLRDAKPIWVMSRSTTRMSFKKFLEATPSVCVKLVPSGELTIYRDAIEAICGPNDPAPFGIYKR